MLRLNKRVGLIPARLHDSIPLRFLQIIVPLFFAIFPFQNVTGQTQKVPAPLRSELVKDELYMISGEGGNVAAYVTGEGVILVDDMFDRNHADILEQVALITGQPLRYVLNTHQHDDHAGGDLKMMAIAEVIAHDNARANLADIKQPYYEDTPGTPIGLPPITFSKDLTIHLGGKKVQALYFGRGHTNGDAIIYFPELKVIHSGDLFIAIQAPAIPGVQMVTNRPPGVNIYVDYAQGGSFLQWTATLDKVLELDFDIVIPGHGPVSTRRDLEQFRADLETMRDRIMGMVRRGASRHKIVDTFEVDYGWRSTGCPQSPPTAGCLQYQQMDALIDELQR